MRALLSRLLLAAFVGGCGAEATPNPATGGTQRSVPDEAVAAPSGAKVPPVLDAPVRVRIHADATLVSPDPGQRVLLSIDANSAALDACLGGAPKLLEAGASPSMSISIDKTGRLVELALDRDRRTVPDEDVSGCMRAVLEKVDFGPADFDRSGFLFFRPDPPLALRHDPDADVARVRKVQGGLTFDLEARRVPEEGGDYHLALAVTVSNTGDAPRGVREILYSNEEAKRAPDATVKVSFVVATDTTLPITCLAPGESVRFAKDRPSLDVIIAEGGRHRSDTFVVVGESCAHAASRVMLGGARLDWQDGASKPSVLALPFWLHQLDPLEPRKIWRYGR